MRRQLLSLAAACALLLPLACDNTPIVEPGADSALIAAGPGGHSLRDSDTNKTMPSDTTVLVADVIAMHLAAGNGNGPQNNKNVVWTSSNPAVVSIVPNKGTVTATAVSPGTSVVTATLGGNSASVTIHVQAPPPVGAAYIVTSSSYTPTAGDAVTITAQLVDGANNPVAVAGRVVTWSSTNGGSFSTAVSLTNGSGIAITSFTTSTVAGTSHVVTATDNLAMTGSTAPIVTQTGAAASMVAHAGQGQSATVGTAVAVPPAVRVTDANGNPVAGVAVAFAVTSGGGSVTGANANTDANGVAAVGSWTLGNTAGANTLDATSPGLPTVTFTATGTTGAATQLVMHTQPSTNAQAGIPFAQQPAVQLRDAFNNDVATAGVMVTASIATGAGTLAGTLSAVTDVNGRATFSDLRIDGVTGTRTLRFQAAGTSDAISDDVDVAAGPAAAILVTASPTASVGSMVTVNGQLHDQFGNNVSQVAAVTWSSTNGGSFGANPTMTDGSGFTSVQFTVSSTGGVTHVVTATAGAASGSVNITTVNTAPTAGNDTFDAIGNVTIPVLAPGVLANDSDAETSFSAVPGPIVSANGGSVTMNADGSFTYLSAAGYSGSDTFNYSVTDGTTTTVGQVTMNVNGRAWFVDNSATAPGDGRDASPFVLLKDGETASAPGERVFVFHGNGTSTGYNAGFIFKPGQSLIGEGVSAPVTQTVNSVVITLMPSGNAPNIARSTPGTTIALATGNTLRGVSITSTAGAGVAGTAFGVLTANDLAVIATGGPALRLINGTPTATFAMLSSTGSPTNGLDLQFLGGSISAPAGTITGAGVASLNVDGGNGTITWDGVINSTSRAVQVTNRTGGLVTVDGAMVDTGSGILVQDNTGGTVSFPGSKMLNTGASDAVTLLYNLGSTVSFSGAPLAITTAGGVGFMATGGGTITVTGTGNTISSTGATALSVVGAGIGAAGMTFRRISASGAGSGIVLNNSGTGAFLVSGNGAAGTGGTITGMTDDGVSLTSTGPVALNYMSISGNAGNGVQGSDVNGFHIGNSTVLNNGDDAAADEAGLKFTNLSGTASIASTEVAGSVEDNVSIANGSGSLSLSVSGSTFRDNSLATGARGLSLSSTAAASITAVINGSQFLRNKTFGLEAATAGAGALDVSISGGGLENNNVGVNLVHGSSGSFEFDVLNIPVILGHASAPVNINRLAAATGTFEGTVSGNVIGNAAVANSGSSAGSGIRAVTNGPAGSLTIAIANNTIRQVGSRGIDILARDGGTVINATITGNDINTMSAFSLEAISVHSGALATDTNKVCAAISGNIATGHPSSRGIRVRQRFTLTSFDLDGYAGAANNAAAVATYLGSTNTSSPAPLADFGGTGFVGVASCPMP